MKLSQQQAEALLRKHTSGDFGSHTWPTIKVLLAKGMVAEQDKNLVVTAKGRAYCDQNHLNIA